MVQEYFVERPPSPAPDRWRAECQGAKRPAFGVTAGRCSVDGMVRFTLLK